MTTENKRKLENKNLFNITSPLEGGVFYSRPEPDAEPFVKVGQNVREDTTVCIVEAMKVFNEIRAKVRGVVRKILVKNETPLRKGQPLFEVEVF